MAEMLQEDVTIEVGSPSHFPCPKCGRSIRYRNAYPLDFKWKVCPGCRRLWSMWPHTSFTGIRADDYEGGLFQVSVAAFDRSIDDDAEHDV